ncbi:hypothetical protein DENIS_3068 [Desulfonema ishimotonii]|uniref:Filamentous haemagglutinin FhaB/tRNA nuclease CdiA-like TPS domain-containing protein n=1 Tax=Desulfonema ishimotonii TaxID=45657 RepID=A0A401FYR8_9BACT|nr:CHAT domain-containing protein [Desulfonema ishimotonii]GBC62105.1 hypothetical protein DENIS_3068 [Desulfonema ishimotonii]
MKLPIPLVLVILILQCGPAVLYADVSLDGTIGPAGAITFQGPDCDIRAEYGEQIGANLFHSFEQFSISSEESATFSGPTSVENIISRITGGDVSQIDGLLRSAIPGADLYFLNPAGVIFGPGAALDLSGAFHVSTADYLRMGTDEQFYTLPLKGEVLSASPPAAFGFLDSTPGPITFDGSAIESPGSTLSVIGGDISVTNGAGLSIDGGRLNMAGVASAGEVTPENAGLDVSSFTRLGDVTISGSDNGRSSSVYVQYGSIYIRGGRFLADNSEIFADTPYTVTEDTASVLDIRADTVEIRNNALISTDTFGPVDGSDLVIQAEETVDISGSTLRVGSFGTKASGNAGSLTIEGGDIVLRNGAQIQSESRQKSTGNGGDVRLKASGTVSLSDTAVDTFTTGVGNAGNVIIEAGNVQLEEGAEIRAYTQGTGNAGNVEISAEEKLTLQGDAAIKNQTENQGDAGDIRMTASRIQMGETASVSSSGTYLESGAGDAGQIYLRANDSILLEDATCIRTETGGQGQAGDIFLESNTVRITGRAWLSSASTSEQSGGDAGTITVDAAETAELSGGSFLTTEAADAGGGKIRVNAGQTVYLNGGEINTSVARGAENGGDITIGDDASHTGPEFVILSQATIRANADQGDGGAIFITTDNYFRSGDSVVEASSGRGNDGIIRIEAPDADITGSLAVLPDQFVRADQWQKTPCSRQSAENVSRFVIAERDGVPAFFDDWRPVHALVANRLPVNSDSPLAARYAALMESGNFAALAQMPQDIPPDIPGTVLRAAACSALGHYRKALEILSQTTDSDNAGFTALRRCALSDLHLCLGDTRTAIDDLKTAMTAAESSGSPLITAAVLNNQGNIRAVNRDYRGARQAYRQGLKALAGLSPAAPALKSAVRINMTRLESAAGDYREALKQAGQAMSEIVPLTDTWATAADLVAVSALDQEIRQKMGISDDLTDMESRLLRAARIGQVFRNDALVACAYGLLGRGYERAGQYDRAMIMTRKALFYARQGYFPEVLYRCQWQMGRLCRVQGQKAPAIAAFEAAIATLNPIRPEFFNGFRSRTRVFDQWVKPVYLGLTDLLLEGDARPERAREIMELLKRAELQDFFQDECLIASQSAGLTAERSMPRTAMIYPILLPDHLSLLVTLPDGVRQIRVPVNIGRLRRTVLEFREQLEEGDEDFPDNAQMLYNWLIRPVQAELTAHHIETLVIVPDGPLRLIPFAALHDGSRFLVETYALGTVPALSLTSTDPPAGRQHRILLSGLSGGRHGFAPLSNVVTELQSIRSFMDGTVLLDRDFTLGKFGAEMKTGQYDIVHMATHAVFSGSAHETFLLTYDDKLTMDGVDRIVRSSRIRGRQPELLTLSACETALGDERAAFGLAGIAIRAGAKSALATLWDTDDLAAFLAVEAFYRQLKRPDMSKAGALRAAQRMLLARPRYSHPEFWAPFLMIGNWL